MWWVAGQGLPGLGAQAQLMERHRRFTVLYIASMWVNGIAQGLMWRAVNADGTLTYSFVETPVRPLACRCA